MSCPRGSQTDLSYLENRLSKEEKKKRKKETRLRKLVIIGFEMFLKKFL